METRPRILVLSPTNLATDPRVHRQIIALRNVGRVTAAGFADPCLPGVEFISIDPGRHKRRSRAHRLTQLLARRYTSYYNELPWVVAARATLPGRDFDLIVGNDAESWPLALELRGRGRVLLDAHEYTPREFENEWWWRLFYQRYKIDLCRRCLHRGDSVLTVCDGIADEYKRVFGTRPTVVMNVPAAAAALPSPVMPDRVRMIHHGGANPARKIEHMLRLVDLLDERFTLDLMLVPAEGDYVAYLRRLAANQRRVRFLPPVPMPQIANAINGYDLGLYLLEPNSFNNFHALPNKFFEFIQARLGVAIGPSPEMAQLVRRFDCGIVAPDFRPASLARMLSALSPDTIRRYKQNSHRAADVLCWEHESTTLQREVERLLSVGPCAA